MKDVTTLKGLMIVHLQSLYDAENKWAQALKEESRLLKSTELQHLFEKGSRVAETHAGKLKKILTDLGQSTLAKKNHVAADLIRELNEMQDTAADAEVLDAAVIVTHQCMNHYLIAKYGTAASYARLLLEEDIAGVLHKIVEEEKAEDEQLTRLAEDKINIKAKASLIL
ncbi:MAG: ferritin-like domain-containing protein [Flavisolibacter sp.]